MNVTLLKPQTLTLILLCSVTLTCLINSVCARLLASHFWAGLGMFLWRPASVVYTLTPCVFFHKLHYIDKLFITLQCYYIMVISTFIDDVLNKIKCLLSVTCQSVLGAEGLSLAFRHIVSSLLWYCSQHSSEELLHEVIICVGYFTVNHPDNQVNENCTAMSAQKWN